MGTDLSLFELALKESEKRFRQSSLKVYASMWAGLETRLALAAAPPPGQASKAQLVAAIRGAGDAETQLRLYRLMKWAMDIAESVGVIAENPSEAMAVYFSARPRPPAEPVSDEFRAEMLDVALRNARGWKGQRLAALVAVAIDTGARRQELLQLELGQLRMLDLPARLHVGRGAKSRWLELSPRTKAVLHDWLTVRPKVESDLLFPANLAGEALHAATVWRQLKKLAQQVEGGDSLKHYGAGLLRVSAANERDSKGSSVQELQQFLGHHQATSTAELVERVRSARSKVT